MQIKSKFCKRIITGITVAMVTMASMNGYDASVKAEEVAEDALQETVQEDTQYVVNSEGDAEESLGRTVYKSGKDGGVSWTIYDDGFLDIHITGDLSFEPELPDSDKKTEGKYWPYYEYCQTSSAFPSVKVKVSGTGLTKADMMFAECSKIESIDFSGFDTSKVTSMQWMFYRTGVDAGLKSLDLSGFNTGKVNNMGQMFAGSSSVESINLSSFNTSNVNWMIGMFEGCSSLKRLDLKNFNTKNIWDMSELFKGCKSLTSINLSSFNTEKVIRMDELFYGCSSMKNLDIHNFEVSKCHMSRLFYGCSSLVNLDMSNFDLSDAETVCYGTFTGCKSLKTIKTPKALGDSDGLELPGIYRNKAGKERRKIVDANDVYTRVKSINSMYRLYNPNSGEHFYTGDINEVDTIVKAGWKNEGIAWNAPSTSKTPVYRLYNPNAGDHHYTTSETEKNNLVNVGWKYEGIGWYSDDNKGVALQRLYNPNATTGSHHYTISISEKDNLVKAGWKYEGLAWYGMK